MKSEKIIDSRLFIPFPPLEDPGNANTAFEKDLRNRGHLGSQLLLYETIAIPTLDMAIVPILIKWLGIKGFEEAIAQSAFQFLRYTDVLGYVGNGVGLSTFRIDLKPPIPRWWQEAVWGDMEKSLHLQLEYGYPSITSRRRSELVKTILPHCHLVEMTNEFATKNIHQESYRDIMENSWLAEQVMAGNSTITLERLPGVGPNEIQSAVAGNGLRNAIDLVLRVAEFNRQIVLSSQADDADILCSEGAEQLLVDKLVRIGVNRSLLDGFLKLLDLTRIPDVREAVASQHITLIDLWAIRQKPVSIRFREWLRKCETKDPRELERLYVEAIDQPQITNSGVTRSLRFATTTLAGLAGPLAGVVASGIDSFFVDKLLSGYSPKLFLDELRPLRP